MGANAALERLARIIAQPPGEVVPAERSEADRVTEAPSPDDSAGHGIGLGKDVPGPGDVDWAAGDDPGLDEIAWTEREPREPVEEPAGPAWRRVRGALADHLPPTLRGGRWQLSGRAAAGLAVGLAVAVGTAAFVGRDQPELINPGVVAVTTTATLPTGGWSAPAGPGPSATQSGVVVVHVAGLVAVPGVFELPIGSRVIDALEAAGGVQSGVDTSTLNLARVLVDGEQISVGVPAAPDADGAGQDGGPASPGAPLDLNTATESELDGLPGVGPVLAGRIVAWRQEHGAFTAVEELLEVSGIGAATLADLVGLVRV